MEGTFALHLPLLSALTEDILRTDAAAGVLPESLPLPKIPPSIPPEIVVLIHGIFLRPFCSRLLETLLRSQEGSKELPKEKPIEATSDIKQRQLYADLQEKNLRGKKKTQETAKETRTTASRSGPLIFGEMDDLAVAEDRKEGNDLLSSSFDGDIVEEGSLSSPFSNESGDKIGRGIEIKRPDNARITNTSKPIGIMFGTSAPDSKMLFSQSYETSMMGRSWNDNPTIQFSESLPGSRLPGNRIPPASGIPVAVNPISIIPSITAPAPAIKPNIEEDETVAENLEVKEAPYTENQIVFPASVFRSNSEPTTIATKSYALALLLNEMDKGKKSLPQSLSNLLLITVYADMDKCPTTNNIVLPAQPLVYVREAETRLNHYIEMAICWQLIEKCSKLGLSNLSDKLGLSLTANAFKFLETVPSHLESSVLSSEKLIKYELRLAALFESGSLVKPSVVSQIVEELGIMLRWMVQGNCSEGLLRMESLLVCLLGAEDEQLRDFAVRGLNSIYDGHLWQLEQPLEPQIRCVGDRFEIDVTPTPEQWNLLPKSPIVLEVVTPSPTSGKRFMDCHRRVRTKGNKLFVRLPAFARAGYYDWRFSILKDGQLVPLPILPLTECQGRFIVHPAVRNESIHEVFVDLEGSEFDLRQGGPLKKRGKFTNITKKIESYACEQGITTVYVAGALQRANFGVGHPFACIDRSHPNTVSGGHSEFKELLVQASKYNVKIVVDATARLALRGLHRKYDGLETRILDEFGRKCFAFGTDGGEHEWKDSVLVNYRDVHAWNQFILDIREWASTGVSGVRIDSAHTCPLILHANIQELCRKDCDGLYHYQPSEILKGKIVLPPKNEAIDFGYFNTAAFREGYPNPLFIKTTSELWKAYPNFLFLGEVFLNRECMAIRSGLIPYTDKLPQALRSIFGIGVSKDGILQRIRRESVKCLYDWYELERGRYPQNSILLFPSSGHYSPYPTAALGSGAWAAVDLVFFLPEVPVTFIGEHYGWLVNVDLNSGNMVRSPVVEFRDRSHLPQIFGHYQHRAYLRRNHSTLADGGMVMLYAKRGDQNWHDRVFAFARFNKTSLIIVAINFNDVESQFYVDCSPLEMVCQEKGIYKKADLINPTNPPVYYNRDELLNEKQYIQLGAYEASCWAVHKEEDSPASQRVLMEHSIKRLQKNLVAGTSPAHNIVYSKIVKALDQQVGKSLCDLIKHLQESLPPTIDVHLPTLIQHALHRYAIQNQKQARVLAFLRYFSSPDSGCSQKIFAEVLERNILGPIIFITPEIGKFSTVGGIGVMVDELTKALAELGCDIYVISPYYIYNRKGETNYLVKEGVDHWKNIVTYVGDEKNEVGVHKLVEHKIKYYFIHHFDYFPTPYHAGSPIHQLKTILLFAKASLELCCQLRLLPSVIVTNDWFTGFVPAYGKQSGAFGATFSGTTFFHLVHNLEEGYEGKIYFDGNNDMGYITHLPRELTIDPSVNQMCINSSRTALICSSTWGTVSKSYLHDLMYGSNPSPLRYLLARFPEPFAHSNGIRVAERRSILAKVALNHEQAKESLQKKYFKNTNPVIPVFSFVGRICLQKGVHLILNAVPELIQKFGGRIQIIIGGMANMKDPYAAQCAWSMRALHASHPESFWANPDEFFVDGPLVNLGSDFALMPSLFEPSGVVQQEYFAAGTPVIAFRTGGLKDTVFEYNRVTKEGNGVTFEAHAHADFVQAVCRAVTIFTSPKAYESLRQNAYNAVLDNSVVAQAWAGEFARLRRCIFADEKEVQIEMEQLKSKAK